MDAAADKVIREYLGFGQADNPNRVYHFSDPRLPQFAFEWHPKTQKVYRIDFPGAWYEGGFLEPAGGTAKGHVIAEHAMTHAMAFGFVQTFCRGYLKAFIDHHQGGPFGADLPERIKETDPCPTR